MLSAPTSWLVPLAIGEPGYHSRVIIHGKVFAIFARPRGGIPVAAPTVEGVIAAPGLKAAHHVRRGRRVEAP